ncbi:uncharacterized protein L969DRAFT_16492 [Mixia osmundae IAM 14324]|uniref:uncharacterized protein n=1 Tax=Mixia osmundae (strain CBS 9802 / IAM 14324 / JCM 22182 / KY 12970) TaxID=764103 RepID=UPI0004A54944|nr:uncharacterized protein L969DRAFT_16492 [Mixia osmundae IAM 14324]KEI39812.1 hypothetical protein L969DRAFT_16492 [Mixia osmundae IAM 14324]
MRYAVLVTGPAGSGKTTLCGALIAHAQTLGRSVHLFNLDPAAEHFDYQPSIDVKDLISLDEVMEDLQMGPNGGLIYCFEYLLQNMDWLDASMGDYEDDFLIVDCQIELYTHIPLIPRLVAQLNQLNVRMCALYLIESQFMEDTAKYFSGVLSAMSCMINLELPHLNLMTKMDLVKSSRESRGAKPRQLERYLEADPMLLTDEINAKTNPKFHALNETLVDLIQEYSMVSFLPVDASDEESLTVLLSHIDNVLQYGENEEVKEPKDLDGGDFPEEED